MVVINNSGVFPFLQVPHILTSLQKSVHAVLLGKTVLPDWLNSGIKNDARMLKITLPKTERGPCPLFSGL